MSKTNLPLEEFSCEERLEQALSVSGYLIVLAGESKLEKRILCERVIGLDRLVKISGSDIRNRSELWHQIGLKAVLLHERSVKSEKETSFLTKESVISYFKMHNLGLFLDDIDCVSDEIQTYMLQQFKDTVRKGLRVIISIFPYQINDLVRINPDLQGRISIIDMKETGSGLR